MRKDCMNMNKKLYRSKNDRKISGVCAGIAMYFNIDPTIIRLLWVLISLFTGGFPGLLMYIACVFIIEEESDYLDVQYKEK